MSQSDALVHAVGQLVEALPDGAIATLIAALDRDEDRGSLATLIATPAYREAIRRVLDSWQDPRVSSQGLRLSIECARERQRAAAAPRVSVVWTGPSSAQVPVRRTEQVLQQVIEGAQERLILTSFALYRVPSISAAISAARARGVRITFIAEPRPKDGATEVDVVNWVLGAELMGAIDVLIWDERHRLTTPKGDRGVVHAKCAVADGNTLLVSSANLTEYAMSINIELGLLLRDGDAPGRVQRHLELLIASGCFRAARGDSGAKT